jgi:hypothetical protein
VDHHLTAREDACACDQRLVCLPRMTMDSEEQDYGKAQGGHCALLPRG